MSKFTLNSEDKEWILRIDDFFDAVKKYKTQRFTKFCDPRAVYVFEKCVKTDPFVNTMVWGGYDDSERAVIGFFPDFCEPYKEDFPVRVLEICGNSEASHRDYLGSVLALGIKREMIGDILVSDSGAVMFVLESIADFITFNLKKVASKHVTVTDISESEIEIPKRRVQEFFGTVASVRLDCVVGLFTKLARSEVSKLIESERVCVNYAVSSSPSEKLCKGDIISVRSYGKAEVVTIGEETKKGRIKLTIAKYV